MAPPSSAEGKCSVCPNGWSNTLSGNPSDSTEETSMMSTYKPRPSNQLDMEDSLTAVKDTLNLSLTADIDPPIIILKPYQATHNQSLDVSRFALLPNRLLQLLLPVGRLLCRVPMLLLLALPQPTYCSHERLSLLQVFLLFWVWVFFSMRCLLLLHSFNSERLFNMEFRGEQGGRTVQHGDQSPGRSRKRKTVTSNRKGLQVTTSFSFSLQLFSVTIIDHLSKLINFSEFDARGYTCISFQRRTINRDGADQDLSIKKTLYSFFLQVWSRSQSQGYLPERSRKCSKKNGQDWGSQTQDPCFSEAIPLFWGLQGIHSLALPQSLHLLRITYLLSESPVLNDHISGDFGTYTGCTDYFMVSVSFWLDSDLLDDVCVVLKPVPDETGVKLRITDCVRIDMSDSKAFSEGLSAQ